MEGFRPSQSVSPDNPWKAISIETVVVPRVPDVETVECFHNPHGFVDVAPKPSCGIAHKRLSTDFLPYGT